MADLVFNISKGEIKNYTKLAGANDALIFVLLKTAQADATLLDHDDLGALLAAGGGTANVEANFTNYARKSVTAATITVDDTNDRVDIDVADQTWVAAGGGVNNSTVKLLICYDPDTTTGTDSTVIPLSMHDFAITTDGSDVTAQIAAAGFARAA